MAIAFSGRLPFMLECLRKSGEVNNTEGKALAFMGCANITDPWSTQPISETTQFTLRTTSDPTIRIEDQQPIKQTSPAKEIMTIIRGNFTENAIIAANSFLVSVGIQWSRDAIINPCQKHILVHSKELKQELVRCKTNVNEHWGKFSTDQWRVEFKVKGFLH